MIYLLNMKIILLILNLKFVHEILMRDAFNNMPPTGRDYIVNLVTRTKPVSLDH